MSNQKQDPCALADGQEAKKRAIIRIAYVLFAFIVVFVVLIRAFFSVELTDEIHGVASIFNIIQGSRPFMDSWDYHTGWCLLAPEFWLYSTLTGGLEGVVLFSRLLYVLVSVGTILFAAWLVSKGNENGAWLVLLASALFVPFSIIQLNYNSLTILLILLACSLMESSRFSTGKCFLCAGVVMGLCCVNYPTMIVAAALLPLFFLLNKHGCDSASYGKYIIGALCVALMFSIYVASGERSSPQMLLDAFHGMLTSPHQASYELGIMAIFENAFLTPLCNWFNSSFPVVALCFVQIVWWGLALKGVMTRRAGSLFFFVTVAVAVLCSLDGLGTGFFSFSLFLITIVRLLTDCRLSSRRYAPFLLSALLFGITYALTSDNHNFMTGMYVALPLAAFSAMLSVIDLPSIHVNTKKNVFLPLLISVIIALPCAAHLYGYVYRDDSLNCLSYRVEEGIYKGLFTTNERASLVVETEKAIRSEMPPFSSLCVVTCEPELYLMSDARICAPQTWDAQFLYRGKVSAKPLLSYFAAINEYPDIIAATDTSPVDFYENDAYEIKQLLNSDYEVFYDSAIEGMRLTLWRKL